METTIFMIKNIKKQQHPDDYHKFVNLNASTCYCGEKRCNRLPQLNSLNHQLCDVNLFYENSFEMYLPGKMHFNQSIQAPVDQKFFKKPESTYYSYCEICKISFAVYEEHILTEMHKYLLKRSVSQKYIKELQLQFSQKLKKKDISRNLFRDLQGKFATKKKEKKVKRLERNHRGQFTLKKRL